jgi:hypothetical protein
MDSRAVFAFEGPVWKDPGLLDRYWSKVDRRGPEECWPWCAFRRDTGYGLIKVRGVFMAAHRFGWMVANEREWPAGMLGCHSCDNPICVNPSHVWPGTDLDNFHDAKAKGRWGGPAAENAVKVRCKHGHDLAGVNLIISKEGWRRCRTCARRRTRDYMRRQRYA